MDEAKHGRHLNPPRYDGAYNDSHNSEVPNEGSRMDTTASAPPLAAAPAPPARRIYRHRLPVRLMHWINVVCLTILLGSGLNIFNAHPALYWGHDSTTVQPWLSMRGENTPAGPVGKTRFAGTDFTTTGVLGVSKVDGETRLVRFRAGQRFPARNGWRWRATGTCSSPGCS